MTQLIRDIALDAPCEALPWDSEFWGFPIARVRGHTLTPQRMAAIDHWCHERDIACLYFLATFDDPLTVRSAEDGQFRLVDARVTATITAARFAAIARTELAPGVVVRPAREADVEELQRIAAQSYRTTRFHFDQHFPRAMCEQFYARYIAESCRGFADAVIVVDLNGAPVGYASCHLPTGDEAARIGLLDVAPQARQRGIGQALIGACLDWFAPRGIDRAIGVTQARNIAIQAFNDRIGFVTQSFQLWYHRWYYVPVPETE